MTDYLGDTYVDVYVNASAPSEGGGLSPGDPHQSLLTAWEAHRNSGGNLAINCTGGVDSVSVYVQMNTGTVAKLLLKGDWQGPNGSDAASVAAGSYTLTGDGITNVKSQSAENTELHFYKFRVKTPLNTPLGGSTSTMFQHGSVNTTITADSCYFNWRGPLDGTYYYVFRYQAAGQILSVQNCIFDLSSFTTSNNTNVANLTGATEEADTTFHANNNILYDTTETIKWVLTNQAEEPLFVRKNANNLLIGDAGGVSFGTIENLNSIYNATPTGTSGPTTGSVIRTIEQQKAYYVAPDTGDFTLAASPVTDLKDTGLDVQSYSLTTLDIAGTDRTSGNGLWDKGVFEDYTFPFPDTYTATQTDIDSNARNSYWIGDGTTVDGDVFSFSAVSETVSLPVTIDANGFFIVHSNGIYVSDRIEFARTVSGNFQPIEYKDFTVSLGELV